MISLGSAGCPELAYVDQVVFQLTDPPTSALQVLGLKVCTTMPGLKHVLRVNVVIYLLFDAGSKSRALDLGRFCSFELQL